MTYHDRFSRPLRCITGILMLKLMLLACLILAMICAPSYTQYYDGLLYIVCVISLTDFGLSVITWRAATGSIFNLYGMFLISAYLFNGGKLSLEVFHLNEDGLLEGKFPLNITLDAACLASLCLSLLHFGALVAVMIDRRKRKPVPIVVSRNNEKWAAHTIGWGMLSLAAIPAILVTWQALAVALGSGYHAIYEKEAATGLEAGPMVIAGFLIPGAIYMLSAGRSRRITTLVAVASLGAYCLPMLLVGIRGHSVTPLIACLWIYERRIRRLPKTLLLAAGLFVMLVLFPLIRVTRDISGRQQISLSNYLESYSTIDNPVIDIVGEMGGSLSTVAYTIELVPTKHPYEMGVSYLYALLTVFPNLSGGLHPAIARGLPSQWLTWEVAPKTAAVGGGLGFSFIAEAYLNFGSIGAPFLVFFLGLGLASFQLWADRSGGSLELACVACYMSYVLFFARSEACIVVRPLFWHSMLPYFVAKMLCQGRCHG